MPAMKTDIKRMWWLCIANRTLWTIRKEYFRRFHRTSLRNRCSSLSNSFSSRTL